MNEALPACAVCRHVHRVTDRHDAFIVLYDQACFCGCTASRDEYDTGLIVRPPSLTQQLRDLRH